MTVATVTRTAHETGLLAERVGALLRAGDVVVLAGELGVGKTVFAKGVALALGITEPVVSPSFTIVRQYAGTLPLVHVDVYRIDHLQELYDIGFDELVGDDVITLVEWGAEIVDACAPIAATLDAAQGGSRYRDAVSSAKAGLANPASKNPARPSSTESPLPIRIRRARPSLRRLCEARLVDERLGSRALRVRGARSRSPTT